MQLEDLRLIEQLTRSSTLAQTARALDQTPAAISLRLKRLEQKLGTSLVQRTTRTLVFTEQGKRLVEAAREALSIVDEIPQRVGGAAAPLSGHLQVAGPFGFARAYIAPALARFRALHPAVQCTLQLSEHPLGELDRANVLAIQIGHLNDSGLIAHAICDNARWLVASPAYVARHGKPAHPRELVQHHCLALRENNEDNTLWRFTRGDEVVTRRIHPVMRCNDGETVRAWAVAGHGIALRSEWDVAALVRAGKLVRLLPGYSLPSAPVVALMRDNLRVPTLMSTFAKFLQQQFKPKPPWRL
jgi:DNA-binding transcriptional LysR family regulator